MGEVYLSEGGPSVRRRYLCPVDDIETRARDFLERRTAIAMLSTIGADGTPESCILIAPQLTDDGHVAGGEEADVSGEVFRNLRRSSMAALVVLDPIMDPRARDGVRMTLEFLGAEEDGERLQKLCDWLGSFAPGRQVVRRLLFKVLTIKPYRPRSDESVLIQ